MALNVIINQFLTLTLILTSKLVLKSYSKVLDSNSCIAIDKSDTFGPKLLFHCHNRMIVNVIKASKASHVLIEVWPLYDTDNPISFDWLPRLNESDVKLLENISSYTISIYSTDLKEGVTYTQMVQQMGIPLEEVNEVFLQGCINFHLLQLEGLRNLWRLYISGSILNQTNEDSTDLGGMFPELRLLSLKLNNLNSLPKIDSILFLEEFLLDMNEVKEIPDGYFENNRHLSTIYINELTLESAPKDLFKGMEFLESLTYRTSLSEFPDLQGCYELQALEIQSPETRRVSPNMLKDQKHLLSLNLFGCDIVDIDEDSFVHLNELREIDLSLNQIQTLPPALFSNNTELWNIDLSYNNFTKFSDEVLPNKTKTLNLRYTQIQIFNVTKRLESLDEIDISNSELSGTLDITNFTKFYPNIRTIMLGGNQLTNLTVLSNIQMKRDTLSLDLQDNRITTISVVEGDSNGKTRLKVNLAGNPLRCDCYLKRFVQVLMQKENGRRQFHINRDVKCTWPKNKTLFTVDLSEMLC